MKICCDPCFNDMGVVMKKDAFQNTGFSHLKCQLKQKKLTQYVFMNFQVSANEEKAK